MLSSMTEKLLIGANPNTLYGRRAAQYLQALDE
jgi:hypothetical protein